MLKLAVVGGVTETSEERELCGVLRGCFVKGSVSGEHCSVSQHSCGVYEYNRDELWKLALERATRVWETEVQRA